MDALKPLPALALLLAPISAHAQPAADPVARWQLYVDEASARFEVPAVRIERVIRAESGGRTIVNGKPVRSRAGAIGLMQLMPATWATMRDIYHLGDNPDDPHDNIIAGTAYLRMMDARFGYPGLFAAYNAGPERYAAYLAGRSRLPGETIAYLNGITGGRPATTVTVASSPSQFLFALRHDLGELVPQADTPRSDGGIFVIRKGQP
jgi:soluble lytic murein transglycosylase-like protein